MKQLNFPGSVDSRVIGSIVGPTLLGEWWLTIYAVEWDQAANRTIAHLRPATQPEFDAQRAA